MIPFLFFSNKFAAGDKVTFTGQDYLCTKCLEKYEKQITGSPNKKSATLPAKMPKDEVGFTKMSPDCFVHNSLILEPGSECEFLHC